MLQELKADLARYPGGPLERVAIALRSPGFYPVVMHRIGHDIHRRWPTGLAKVAKLPYKIAALFTEWATGVYISPDATIGPGLYVGHWGCIRVSREVKMGVNCNLSPMVIIGFGARAGKTGVPSLGDRVYVAAGAKVIGPIQVGNDVAIGANAVVCKDVPDHVTVGGVPAEILSQKGSAPYLQVGQKIGAPTPDQSLSDLERVRRMNEDLHEDRTSRCRARSSSSKDVDAPLFEGFDGGHSREGGRRDPA